LGRAIQEAITDRKKETDMFSFDVWMQKRRHPAGGGGQNRCRRGPDFCPEWVGESASQSVGQNELILPPHAPLVLGDWPRQRPGLHR
jgi:hypothetical protein